MAADRFTVKMTGGTNGDVAGNAMKLLLERCPGVEIRCIVAGAGALYDPSGLDHEELQRLILQKDVVDFNAERLHPGGFMLSRSHKRTEGLKELHRRLTRTSDGVEEDWITIDEMYRELDALMFTVPADLFLPCGGRPETINEDNWQRLFSRDREPGARVISEGANSFITPKAREEIQKRGIVVLRDASANKCGVISSSYEILANLILTEREFIRHKDEYVQDVLTLLEKRAEDEAQLIFQRHREAQGNRLYTEISDAISLEINKHYENLFSFFQGRPELIEQPLFRKVILNHLPAILRDNRRYRARIKQLPPKIQFAILASEIASSIVYRGGWDTDLESRIKGFLRERLSL
jgi:glutamate dehydrogenase